MEKRLQIISSLSVKTPSKIVLLVLDGLGDLPVPELGGKTPLEYAKKPNLTQLSKSSYLGLMDPVMPGVTPGSGPGHLGLFGYEPLEYQIGRGVIEGLGIGFEFTSLDVAIRVNFATMDSNEIITDRRAGRIPTEEAAELCEMLQRKIKQIEDVEIIIKHVKEHRAVVIFRGENLGDNLEDTDPQKTGVKQLQPTGKDEISAKTAKIAATFLKLANEHLKGRKYANTILMRGFSKYTPLPSFEQIYKLKACAIATYPMYRGLARLAGMEVVPTNETIADEVKTLAEVWENHDFFFIHIKKTDSYGEDGNWEKKVSVIEEVDRVVLPEIISKDPRVIAITGDHSTPCILRSHSWHPVPIMIKSPYTLPQKDVDFGERHCSRGTLGRFPAKYLMAMLLSHAGKLQKFGA